MIENQFLVAYIAAHKETGTIQYFTVPLCWKEMLVPLVTDASELCSLVFIVTSVCFLSSKKAVSWSLLWFPAGAVVSSKGERGKPSRDTSERREQRELEILWSLSSFNGSNYTAPIPQFYLLHLYPPLPSFPLTLFPPSLYLPPLRAPSCSALPCSWQGKGTLRSYWLHNRLLIPLSVKK